MIYFEEVSTAPQWSRFGAPKDDEKLNRKN